VTFGEKGGGEGEYRVDLNELTGFELPDP